MEKILSKILKNLYIGDRQTLENPLWRKEIGITAVLNCAAEINLKIRDRKIRDEENYQHLHIYDMDWLGDENIILGIHFIEKNLRAGRKVLVSCNAGMSRSVGIVLAYMVSIGWDYDDAFMYIREKHPIMKPCYLVELSIKRFFNLRELW